MYGFPTKDGPEHSVCFFQLSWPFTYVFAWVPFPDCAKERLPACSQWSSAPHPKDMSTSPVMWPYLEKK